MIKTKRKNPKELSSKEQREMQYSLENAIAYGMSAYLSDALVIIKQGVQCDDCDSSYYQCDCEECPECGLNSCMCKLNLNFITENSNKVRKIAWDLIKKYNLENENLRNNILRYYNRSEHFSLETTTFIRNLITTFIRNLIYNL